MDKKKLIWIAPILLVVIVLAAVLGKKNAAPAPAAPEKGAEAAAEAAAEQAEEVPEEPVRIANDLFELDLPDDLKEICEAEITDNSINVYDKEAKENFGGFAFGFAAYENQADYASPMVTKIGEMTKADGTVYDVILSRPSDVQYDFQDEAAKERYLKLYDAYEEVAEKYLVAVDGEYVNGAGTKGEDLYGDVLQKYVTALSEGWSPSAMEEAEMSPMFGVLAMDPATAPEFAGYAYFDVNLDGVDELLVGEIAEDDWKGIVYDVYTIVDRQPAHVVSGWHRNRFFALEHGLLMNEFSESAAVSGWASYDIEPGTANLYPQCAFKLDSTEGEEEPWFASYDYDAENGEWTNWEKLSEEDWTLRRGNFDQYVRFDYTPFSTMIEKPEEEAPAEEAPSEEAAAEEAAPAEEAPVGMPNPWKKVTEEEAKAGVKALFNIPEGAENVVWSVMEGEKPLVQASFDLNGLSFTARAQEDAAPEDDIAGMFYTWTAEDEAAVKMGEKELPGKVCRAIGEKETADLITWFDEETKTLYSLSTVAENLDGFDIQAIAEGM